MASDDDGCGHGVKNAEHANPDHELFQLVRLAAAHLLLDDVPDAEQRYEPAQQERYSQRQVDDEWRQDEHFKVIRVLVSYVTHASERIPVDGRHDQHAKRLDGGYQPSGQVEVL